MLENYRLNYKSLDNIELPEIIGQIKPTEIAEVLEQNIIIPISDNMSDTNSITRTNIIHNEYAFYNIEEGNESEI